MERVVLMLMLPLFAVGASSQTTEVPSRSDPFAVTLAQQSIAALKGGVKIEDVSLDARVISIRGGDAETGTAKLVAAFPGKSRVDLNLSGSRRSETRNVSADGVPLGEWASDQKPATPYALHNCWTDPSWFFPALSYLSYASNPDFFFEYVGREERAGASVQHIRVFQISPLDSSRTLRSSSMSETDFYIDAISNLPRAMVFNVHPDLNINLSIPIEVLFEDYRAFQGVQTPFHVQQMLNGTVILDIEVTGVTLNSPPPENAFRVSAQAEVNQ